MGAAPRRPSRTRPHRGERLGQARLSSRDGRLRCRSRRYDRIVVLRRTEIRNYFAVTMNPGIPFLRAIDTTASNFALKFGNSDYRLKF